MTRRELRETIFTLLFMNQFYSEDQLDAQLDIFFTSDYEENIDPEDQEYIRAKLRKIIEKTEEIDPIIEENLKGWKISRINKVDLSILRLATAEMLYDEDVPYKVAINEAVELAKIYSDGDSSSYINGVLGMIAKKKGLED